MTRHQVPSSDDAPPGGWPRPQAAYVHVPFCRHRCGYCNFSVVAGRDDLVDRFLTAIDHELATLVRPRIDTLFIGGGTPTHLSPAQLDRFLDTLTSRFDLQDDVEWSIEANPEDIDAEILKILEVHGVNRVSLGVQSFDDRKLKTLQRNHTGQQAREMIQQVAASIANVSIDLIFAVPGETTETWTKDVATAISLPVEHMSTYALTYEKGTSFWIRQQRGEFSADELAELEMYEHTRQTCSAAGMGHYEISNFARPGFQCRHNLAYWHGRGWYAAGPGAARFVGGVRELNHRSPTTYLKRIEHGLSPVAESDAISAVQYARERAAFGIRMIKGIDLDQLSGETGVDLRRECGTAIDKCCADGLLSTEAGRIRLTDRGILFADSVASALLG